MLPNSRRFFLRASRQGTSERCQRKAGSRYLKVSSRPVSAASRPNCIAVDENPAPPHAQPTSPHPAHQPPSIWRQTLEKSAGSMLRGTLPHLKTYGDHSSDRPDRSDCMRCRHFHPRQVVAICRTRSGPSKKSVRRLRVISKQRVSDCCASRHLHSGPSSIA